MLRICRTGQNREGGMDAFKYALLPTIEDGRVQSQAYAYDSRKWIRRLRMAAIVFILLGFVAVFR